MLFSSVIEKIDKLNLIISAYDQNQGVKLVFDMIPSTVHQNELKEFILNTIKEKINLIDLQCRAMTLHKKHYNTWTLIVDKESAFKCLKLEGKVNPFLYFLMLS